MRNRHGGKFARDLIAEAQAELDDRQARADVLRGDGLKGEIGLDHRLQDQPLGDPLVIACLEARGDVAFL